MKIPMNCKLLLFAFFIVTMSAGFSSGQGPFATIPVTLTISPTAALTSDGTDYIDGKPGVSAKINDYGSYERNFDVSLSRGRYFNLYLQLNQLLASYPPDPQANPGLPTPAFVPSSTAFQGTSLSIHHILYRYHDTCSGADCGTYPQGTAYQNMNYSFTTRGWFGLNAPDKVATQVKFANADDDAMSSLGFPPVESQNNNYPYNTSLLRVTYSPGPPETWVVEPVEESLGDVAALLRYERKKGMTNAGQFQFPFKLIITRK